MGEAEVGYKLLPNGGLRGINRVRLNGADRAARAQLISELSTRVDAAAVQSVDKILVLWRPRPGAEPLQA